MIEEITRQIEESITTKKELKKDAQKILEIVNSIIDAYKKGKKVIIFGNGGSAADSQHIACELMVKFKKKRKPFNALAITTNTSILTASANDIGFENVFSRQLEGLVEKDDIVVAISTSGNSNNILKGVRAASRLKARTVGLTGKDGGMLKKLVDICLKVPSNNVARIQEGHITAFHIICDLVEKKIGKN